MERWKERAALFSAMPVAQGIHMLAGQSTTLVQAEISQQLLDALPWSLIRTVMVPRRILLISISRSSVILWNITTSSGISDTSFVENIHCSQTMYPHHFWSGVGRKPYAGTRSMQTHQTYQAQLYSWCSIKHDTHHLNFTLELGNIKEKIGTQQETSVHSRCTASKHVRPCLMTLLLLYRGNAVLLKGKFHNFSCSFCPYLYSLSLSCSFWSE